MRGRQRRQAGACEAAPLVAGQREWLLDPSEAAASADPVIDLEHQVVPGLQKRQPVGQGALGCAQASSPGYSQMPMTVRRVPASSMA